MSFTEEIAAVLTQKGETRNIATTWNDTEKLEMDLLTKSKAIIGFFSSVGDSNSNTIVKVLARATLKKSSQKSCQ